MSAFAQPTVVLGNLFATEFPELSVPWQAEQAPAPQLVVLNEELAGELGLDTASCGARKVSGCCWAAPSLQVRRR